MTDILKDCPVVPVVAVNHARDAVPLAEALVAGGINAIEITLRTETALDSIHAVAQHVPDMVLGVGTVTTPDEVKACEDAGAQFLVSPALAPKLQQALLDSPLLALPGTATPTEALTAYEAGFTRMKLFPASVVGGVSMIKGIGAPMPQLHFMPTGGVNTDNMAEYLALANVYAVGGTWIAKSDAIDSGDWDGITERARAAMAIAKDVLEG